MSLKRGEIIGYDREGMVYRFTMLRGEDVIPFEISNAALSDLGKRWLTRGGLDWDAVFRDHRDHIEEIASSLYQADVSDPRPPIKIFAKHLPLVALKS